MYLIGIDEANEIIKRGVIDSSILEQMIGQSGYDTSCYIDFMVQGAKEKAKELHVRGRPLEEVLGTFDLTYGLFGVIRRTMLKNTQKYSSEQIKHLIQGQEDILELREKYSDKEQPKKYEHRDLKLTNIRGVSGKGSHVQKIIDFGIRSSKKNP